MAKYTVTRSCGHEEVINLFGKEKDRERRLERSEPYKLCRECYEKELTAQRERENREAFEAAKAMQLPSLTGTKNQVPWAETLRQKMLAHIDKINRRYVAAEKRNNPKLLLAIDFIRSKTEASWWIDHRDLSDYELMELIASEYEEAKVEQIKPPEEVVIEAQAEATVRPDNPLTETVAEITIKKNTLEIYFPEKREDFRQLMRNTLKMEWHGQWERKLIPRNGKPADRAAEAGHRLLAAGFIIRVFDETIRSKSISGDYAPECTSWILANNIEGNYNGWLAIRWDGRNDGLYKAARKLPGSRWDNPDVVVRPEHFEEVQDFAEMYGFKINKAAQKIIETAKKIKMRSLIAEVDEPEKKEPMIGLSSPPVLKVPEHVDIDDEFKDEEIV